MKKIRHDTNDNDETDKMLIFSSLINETVLLLFPTEYVINIQWMTRHIKNRLHIYLPIHNQ
jgi:hypothetical protein